MPNWIQNTLTIEGPNKDLCECIDLVKGDESPFDFNKIIPMPEEIRHTVSPDSSALFYKDKMYRYSDDDDVIKEFEVNNNTEEKIEKLINKYGSSNWYEWSISNWGCKWNADEVQILQQNESSIIYSFLTPWSPPIRIIKELIETFQNLSITFKSDD